MFSHLAPLGTRHLTDCRPSAHHHVHPEHQLQADDPYVPHASWLYVRRMSDPRRYDEQEIAEILRRATEADEALPPAAGTGLTLSLIHISEPTRLQ